ncbi:SDR family oxidoreductase [Hoeflea prorocentri]|uniref:SDR family oxidoreductase n=1 Tax=Hoeflea prorocentri TaxID=1922333 RepID=A0A9X3UEB1_9HYPH|nr:SDR family oxidoreductase [Hoeflea prorocentri]MCY6379742.1 SDR family oxidoreductase [Hoeflea prorocentri]MDA5397542.1 SDR family oxidoreductase [Hoeflea prorocentri]
MTQQSSTRHSDTFAVVTGGTQGLGMAIAKRLAQDGAAGIVVSGRDPEKGRAAAKDISSLGTDCRFIKADVSRVDECELLIQKSIDAFGRVNALVNSAALPSRGTLLETTPELWEAHMNTNARGPMLTMKALVSHLKETGRPGSIVNIISMAAHCGQPFLTAYSTSKGALVTLSRNVANAYAADHIRCNGIMTGWMDTPGENQTQQDFHDAPDDWLVEAEKGQPMGQLVKPDEVAGLASFLLSPESGVITGSIIDFDQVVRGAYPTSGR